MERAKIDLISELRAKGHDGLADNVLDILDAREKHVSDLEKKFDEYRNRYDTLRLALDHFVKTELEHYTEIKSAFPDSDTVGHREYHEKLIKSAEAQTEFYVAMRNEIVKKGAWFTIIALFGLIFVGFQVKFKQWLGL